MASILDLANAGSQRHNTGIGQYDIVKIRETTHNTSIPPKPTKVTFRNADVQNWYNWGQANLVVKFHIEKVAAERLQTFKSDLRNIIDTADLYINGTAVNSHNNVPIWSLMDRALMSEQYYNTVGSQFFCHDESLDDFTPYRRNSFYSSTNGGVTFSGTSFQRPHLNLVGNDNTQAPIQQYPDFDNCLSAVGKRYTLSNIATNATTSQTTGRKLTAKIPLASIYSFLRKLPCVLKNCQFQFDMNLNVGEAAYSIDDVSASDTANILSATYSNTQGMLIDDLYIEVPRVSPTALYAIQLNETLRDSPNLSIGFPAYQVYRNSLLKAGGKRHSILVNNQVDRINRITCLMTPVSYSESTKFDARRTNHNTLNRIGLKVNGVNIPNNEINCSFSEAQTGLDPADVSGSKTIPCNMEAENEFDVHSIYEAYLQQCQNEFLNNPYDTDGSVVMPYRGSGRLPMLDFALLNPMFTFDLTRAEQSDEFISGMSTIQVDLELDVGLYSDNYLWTIVESHNQVTIQLAERSAFVIVGQSAHDKLDPNASKAKVPGDDS